MKHDLLEGYPVLTEKKGDVVAQFKFTVMILKNKTIRIAGLDIDESQFQTENKISNAETAKLLTVRALS
jgi:hypothetical protein